MALVRYLPAGDAAVLVELDTLDTVLALYARLGHHRPEGVVALVPAARTLLVQFSPDQITRGQVLFWLGTHVGSMGDRGSSDQPPEQARVIEIPVQYDGADLAEVAAYLGLSCTQVIERHTGSMFRAAFAGFAPGFLYLTGGDPCFHGLPRRPSPRTRVPAGSVAVAGNFSAVYPADSPGGWQLLGVTALRMWDLDRAQAALLQPGDWVRFRALEGPAHASADQLGSNHPLVERVGRQRARVESDQTVSAASLTVLQPGVQTLLQDAGRPGLTGMGVSVSGALDRAAMRQANQLVANAPDTAVLENALGGLQLRCHGQAMVAVTGAQAAVSVFSASGMRLPAAMGHSLRLEDGHVLKIGAVRAGVRCYVAVQGGWGLPAVLGSLSTDVLARIGPEPLRGGDCLPVNASRHIPCVRRMQGKGVDHAELVMLPRPGDVVTLDVVLGPRDDWFDPSALDSLLTREWLVTPQSNRVGMRLSGEQPLVRSKTQELPSEGAVVGAIQVPANGQPVLFLADHPLTGGYPVIAVVCRAQHDLLGQIPVGARLRFRDSLLQGTG